VLNCPEFCDFFSSANSTSGIRPAIDGSAVFLLSQNGPAAAALRPSGWYFYSTAPALRPSRGPAAAALRPSGWYFYSTAAAEPSPQEPLRPKDGSTSESESELPQEKENPFLQERKELLAKIDEMNDKYKRALAEIENVRRRLTKQAEETKIFGIQSICKDLLDVADVLGLATQSIPQGELAKNAHLKSLFDGLVMTETQLRKVFERYGVSVVNPEGEPFDPNFHEALFEVPDQKKRRVPLRLWQKLATN